MKIEYALGKYDKTDGYNWFFSGLNGDPEPSIVFELDLSKVKVLFTDRDEAIDFRDDHLDEEWKIFPVVTEEGLGR